MKVNVFGYISGDLGYNVHAQGFIEGMMNNGIEVKAVPYEERMASKLSPSIINAIKRKFAPEAPSICLNYGNKMESFYGKKRIGYSVWETSRIPKDWVSPLNELDDVWTVSKFCKKVFEDSGITKNVKIVHEGVDTSVFNPYVKPLQQLYDKNYFTFFSVFKFEYRKSPEILLEAFSEEFKPEEKVRLIIQCHTPFVPNFNPYRTLFLMNLGKRAPIGVIPPVESRNDLASYYKSADCFVLPSKGESWGLPMIESLACGVPVITTNWGGQLEYMNNDIGWLIDVEKMEMPDDGMFFKPQEGNEWAVPSKKHLKELMRYAFEHPEECKKKGGMHSYEYVENNFSWEKSTEIVKELLKE